MKKLKVVLVHDYIKEYGGAERVLETLHETYPDAPIFTSIYLPQFLGPHVERLKNWDIRPSVLQNLPFKQKLISPIRLIAPLIFSLMDFSEYDVVIVSATGAYIPNMIKKGKAIQICYCHTPPRYLYGYATARNWKNNKVLNFLGELANHFLRIIDFNSSQKVDYFIANSNEVAGRIWKFYKREATVVYPPVDVGSSRFKNSLLQVPKAKYYLAGGRLARAKHIDLAIKAFDKLNRTLKIFGRDFAGYGDYLRKISRDNIKFLGEVTDEQKFELMRNAKAFIFPSEDEDFGITPVEAMGMGCPVISYNSGGVKESVIDGKTGVFFDDLTSKSLRAAVKRLDKLNIKSSNCIKQAKKFSKARFKKEIEEFILSHA
ncbi:MAG: glycosyltransferase [Candidatus Woesebacteria bacterium]|nr:MAG: glycosyltransferase [Candidatus Woesebacteria bacterium]